MTAASLLRQNGNFKESPLLETVKKIHRLMSRPDLSYAVIGGLAVIRNGAARTTMDVDILTRRDDWVKLQGYAEERLILELDSGVDRETGVDIDVIFPGDDWEMVIPMPDPEDVKEYDTELGAFFISLPRLLELKTAVFMKKREEDGIEIAAKDLADVVALTQNNGQHITGKR
jgi:hypothetical protein